MSALPASIIQALEELTTLQKSIQTVDNSLQPLLTKEIEQLIENLRTLEGAKLHVAIAYTFASLFYIKLKLKGEDISKHPINDDLNRIKLYVADVNRIEKNQKQEDKQEDKHEEVVIQSNQMEVETKQTNQTKETIVDPNINQQIPNKKIKIDSKAAKRIVKHHL